MNDGNVVCELRLKDRVKVLRASLRDEAVLVCQLGKDANVVAILELGACCWFAQDGTRQSSVGGRERYYTLEAASIGYLIRIYSCSSSAGSVEIAVDTYG